MAKAQRRYVCQSCGATTQKWQGRCDGCGEWNAVSEEIPLDAGTPKGLGGKRGRVIPLTSLQVRSDDAPRLVSGIAEFDRATGGGLVPGSALLIGGDPGIGKSTLLLQVAGRLSNSGANCIYISGEEAVAQVGMRAERLGIDGSRISFGTETNVRDVLTTLDDVKSVDVVIIDSIQTMFVDGIESAPGTVSQVRSSAQELIRFAKRRGIVMMLVGHVTKDGQIAGPRVLEHMVDTVLYFEGERGHQFRILRAHKNRFGGTDEIGVFEMTGHGLEEVANPSALFLSNRSEEASGSVVFAGIEGTRPLLVEIQALVAPSPAANPRRAVVGWDSGRLAMVLAVLDARCGLGLAGSDVYLNVAGGLRIKDPAADLAVAVALISSLAGKPVPANTAVFGELSLSGEVRPVTRSNARLGEVEKLGFARAYIPAHSKTKRRGIELAEIDRVQDLLDIFELSSHPAGSTGKAN
ncbi:MAG: DNA repair protein RadA [Proteobacteria bacterium]|nr:DNA repair protein RadA [Pseudomonadota bacterium]